MKRIRFTPAQVKTVPDDRPDTCPRCGGISTSAVRAGKPVKDLFAKSASVHRCFRQSCERTFRHYPQKMRGWAALMRALGMSPRLCAFALIFLIL